MNIGIPRTIRLGLLPALVIAMACASLAQAPEKYKITVTVTGIRNTTGNVRVALWSDSNTVAQLKVVDIDPKTLKATAVFEEVAPGTYGVRVLHDENNNGKLDFDEMGMPLEGYGHSNNPEKRPGPPNWDEYKFVLDKDTTMEIRLIYWS
jgi:uncharacterized protein (DUF2141 family)